MRSLPNAAAASAAPHPVPRHAGAERQAAAARVAAGAPEQEEPAIEAAAAVVCEVETVQARPHRIISWARLLTRVFDIDMKHCPNCGSGAGTPAQTPVAPSGAVSDSPLRSQADCLMR